MAGHRGVASTNRPQAQQFPRIGKLRGDTLYAIGAGGPSALTADRVIVYADGSRTSSTVPGSASMSNETFSFDAGQYTALSGVWDAPPAPVFQESDDSAPSGEVMILFADGTTITLLDVAHLRSGPVKPGA